MSFSTDDVNPYAPPQEDARAPIPGGAPRRHSGAGIDEALARLREHTSDAAAMTFDKDRCGPRVRPVGLVSGGIAVAGALAAFAFAGQPGNTAVAITICGVIGGIALIIAIIAIPMDLMLAPRDAPSTPERTLKSFMRAIAMNRTGYAWANLCPTAREATVATPSLEPVETVPGEFSLATEAGMKEYLQSFARASKGTIRTVATSSVMVREIDGDVAQVQAKLTFQSWPQWVSIVIAVGAGLFRPLLIVGFILFLVMRKKREVHVTKTLLKAPTGAWYVYDGDLLETDAI